MMNPPPKKTLADAMRNAAANSLIPDEDIDFILRMRIQAPPTALDLQLRAKLGLPAITPPEGSTSPPTATPEQQARNAELEARRPKRENFTDEESFLEAMSGFNHRIVPLLRPLPFVESTLPPSPDGEAAPGTL